MSHPEKAAAGKVLHGLERSWEKLAQKFQGGGALPRELRAFQNLSFLVLAEGVHVSSSHMPRPPGLSPPTLSRFPTASQCSIATVPVPMPSLLYLPGTLPGQPES